MVRRPLVAFVGIDPYTLAPSTTDFFPHFYYGYDPSSLSTYSMGLYKSPYLTDDDWVPFFLSFHREKISSGHYFWYSDYYGFCTNGLLRMAERSVPLQYAVAAFSALIYSVRVDSRAKEFAFICYAKAVRQLQQMINSVSMDSEDSVYSTLATILELASVEVCFYSMCLIEALYS